ncbi:MAG: coproporphyrinogen dehydrogenase HemZ [Clostridia bacterium]|nr:coproporphyrinogen dehydrogenase HemZ [Clostridia bacterium]
MNLCLIGHNFRYELEKLVRIFMPFEKIEFFDTEVSAECFAVTVLSENTAKAYLKLYEKTAECETKLESQDPKEQELKLAIALFECFVELTNYKPQWGILTGVRPAKLFSRLLKTDGLENTRRYFRDYLKVSEKKISLCEKTHKDEENITSLSKSNSFSLYVSVPFCPTRCSYCSFVSHSVMQAKKLIPQYVEFLCEEIKKSGKIASDLGLNLETIYIGGGTPTTLDAEQLTRVMKTVSSSFDLSNLREYTVEAGRPDTITAEKLIAIKNGGATRISINPQTMNDAVLKEIGRQHTAIQTIEAFNLARGLGFDNINMDLIAGLPTDTLESFKDTVNAILKLDPESVTVHSLSMKRAATLSTTGQLPEIEIGKTASDMVDFACETLSQKGIEPYYMYRQSKTVGNLENVGYAKKGYECLYNVYIMDETHTILGCGASAVTKLREPDGELIERIFNFKYPYEYLSRFLEIISRKDGINKFYERFKEEM